VRVTPVHNIQEFLNPASLWMMLGLWSVVSCTCMSSQLISIFLHLGKPTSPEHIKEGIINGNGT
jgi:hypothetical protein